ncbi:DUF423 domain-containing protein [Allomuricauda sp. SCSIO 65647]|uniref:DUF423 domain-containing protein n=1 Tax=Allomuricauda sp. SCSIO 65647 TaxID=2908843 RepID=UPI001F2F154B|nr:DUF423 domain-containing protein [Muricauda sp. SCSIO 65647]UJH66186.1 DUF423 domain-containing protein [Muricauda sp. SCSIO 65647]
MNKTILATGLLFGALAIIFGAFGAHGLKKVLTADELNTFETGVRYQMYHALFLILLSMLPKVADDTKKWVFYAVVIGVVLFSFSIYLLATNKMTSFDFRKIGWVTPIGGLFMILGWIYLILSVLTKK